MHKKNNRKIVALFLIGITLAIFLRLHLLPFVTNIRQTNIPHYQELNQTVIAVLIGLFILFIVRFLGKLRYKKKLRTSFIQDIDHLSGKDFEYFLYYLFKKHRLHVTITPYTHDFGADLILRQGRKKMVIQAKRWNENVGITAVQETIGAMSYYRANYGIVITNSYYTISAIELAKASNIILIDRRGLKELLEEDVISFHSLRKTNEKTVTLNTTNPNRCPLCNNSLEKKNGRYGAFLGCSGYPSCMYTKDYIKD